MSGVQQAKMTEQMLEVGGLAFVEFCGVYIAASEYPGISRRGVFQATVRRIRKSLHSTLWRYDPAT